MLEKIKDKIKINKEDTKQLNNYIKIFSKLSKANELFASDENFQKLKIKDVYE